MSSLLVDSDEELPKTPKTRSTSRRGRRSPSPSRSKVSRRNSRSNSKGRKTPEPAAGYVSPFLSRLPSPGNERGRRKTDRKRIPMGEIPTSLPDVPETVVSPNITAPIWPPSSADRKSAPRPRRRSSSKDVLNIPQEEKTNLVVQEAVINNTDDNTAEPLRGSGLPYVQILLCVLVVGVELFCVYHGLSFFGGKGVVYCDIGKGPTEEYQCTPCPVGYPVHDCVNGELVCVSGFKVSHGKCVEDEELSSKAMDLTAAINNLLTQRKGEQECSHYFTCGGDSGPLSQADLRSYFAQDSRFEDRYGETFNKAITMMRRHAGVDGPYVASEGSNPSEIIWATNDDSSIPWSCVAEYLCRNYWLYLLSSMALIVVILRYTTRRKEDSENVALENLWVEEVLTALKTQMEAADDSNREAEWLAIAPMRDRFFSTQPRMSTDRLRLIWRNVERRMRRDSRVAETERSVKGEQQTCWQWAGGYEENFRGVISPHRRRRE